jgi:hypothetical protein
LAKWLSSPRASFHMVSPPGNPGHLNLGGFQDGKIIIRSRDKESTAFLYISNKQFET